MSVNIPDSSNVQTTDGENNNYLPAIKHEWEIENYPATIENACDRINFNFYGGGKCDFHSGDFGLMRSGSKINKGAGGLHSAQYTLTPFTIGETQWRVKLCTPSFDLFLKRVTPCDGTEHLAFRCSAASYELVEIEDDYENYDRTENVSSDFKYLSGGAESHHFTAANRKVRLGELPPRVEESSRIRLVFEALVRPENFAMGAPCDFRVVVLDKNDEGKVLGEFAAHRSVLGKGSPVFRAMLGKDSKFEEAKTGVLKIGNFAPETVKTLLAFIYIGQKMSEFSEKSSALMELLDAAEQYQVHESLKLECGRRLLKLIRYTNALKILAKAELYKLDELKQGAMHYIRDNRRRIIRGGKKDEKLNVLPPELKDELLKYIYSKGNKK